MEKSEIKTELEKIKTELETDTVSRSKVNLIKALICFHKEVGEVIKNAKNPFFKSNYADLNAYLEIIKEPLINNGLVLIQEPIENGLRSTLYHTSGEYTTSDIKMQFPNDPQKVGSILTYFRRYALSSILGLGAKDDDANSATSKIENAEEELKKNILINNIEKEYAKVKTPNSKLVEWIRLINDHSEIELNLGFERIKKIIKEQ